MKVIGEKLEDVRKLQPEKSWCVILPPETDVSTLSTLKFEIEVNFLGGYVVTRKPDNFSRYVKSLLSELVEFPGEVQTIKSYGKLTSERATIHHVASDLGMTISCKKSNGVFLVEHLKDGMKKPPWWVQLLKKDKFVEIEHGVNLKFTNFRGQVYRWARTNQKSVTVRKQEKGVTLVKLNGGRSKSIQKRFNEFLDTIAPGDSVLLPGEFSEMKDGYIRVLLSNHDSKFSYRGGLITHLTNETDSKDCTNQLSHPDSTTPHIDSNGHFIMGGHNYGLKPDRWIQLKLKHTEWTLEDVRR